VAEPSIVTAFSDTKRQSRLVLLGGFVATALLGAACSNLSDTVAEPSRSTATGVDESIADNQNAESANADSDSEIEASELSFAEAESDIDSCKWEFTGEALTDNRRNELPNETLQVVLFYDGDNDSDPTLTIKMGNAELLIGADSPGGPISAFGEQIETREYRTAGCSTVDGFRVNGVVPDGVIDGLAYGALFKDASGNYSMFKSNETSNAATFVGMWPLGMTDEVFAARTPQLEDPSRQSAEGIIWGAALVENDS